MINLFFRWSFSIRSWPGVAFPVRNVPVQFHGFGALSAAGAAVCALSGHEEEVADVSALGKEN